MNFYNFKWNGEDSPTNQKTNTHLKKIYIEDKYQETLDCLFLLSFFNLISLRPIPALTDLYQFNNNSHTYWEKNFQVELEMLELGYKYTYGCVTEYIIQIYKEEETKTHNKLSN